MSFFKRYWALSILGWFLALLIFNVAFHWPQNANKNGLYIFLEAIGYLTTPVELAVSAAVVYGLVSKRPLISTARLATYIAVGLLAIGITIVLTGQKQVRNAYTRILKSYSGSTIGKRKTISPTELFQEASPSVFVVEALDENGKTLMFGSGVALARDFLITNCHVVQGGSSLRMGRGKDTWTARLIQAVPAHDLCGLKPSGLSLHPIDVRPSSTLSTGEYVYAIGSPEGLELTFSEGVISALRDTEGVHMIQTTAPISPGSSGGGLFDTHGNLVGITSFYLKEGQSLNFALPGEWVTDALARSKLTANSSLSDAALESAAWIDIGLEAVKKEDYNLAVNSFSKCTDLKQADAYRASFELGMIWEKAFNGIGNTSAYKAWLCSNASSKAECVSFFVGNLAQARAQRKAIAAFEKAIELKPDYAEAWLDLGLMHFRIREYAQAITAEKEATRLAPGDYRGWMKLGTFYSEAGSYDLAIDAFQRAEKVAGVKNWGYLLFLLGEAYAKKGDREQVLEFYKKLKAVDSGFAKDFFHKYVLQERQLTDIQKYQLLAILRNAPITDNTRDAAWDAFYAASDQKDFKRRFDALPLPDDVKAQIWDLKFASPRSMANPSPK